MERTIPKSTIDDETPSGGRRGAPRAPVRQGEPGATYVTALRRWPDELRPITNTELADQLGISQSSLSAVLQNGPGWKATPTLLEHALKIINICGGEPEDLTNWTRYHDRVVAYQATRRPPLPTPPEPARFARARSVRAGLFEPRPEMGKVYLPSALLLADHGIVPFEHRQDDLGRLVTWAESAEPVSSLLVTAAGGQGKTRLALRLCEILRSDGWLADFLAHDVPEGLLDADGVLEPRTLLVIDYAEAAPTRSPPPSPR